MGETQDGDDSMNVLIIGGTSKSLVNFRGTLIRAMLSRGHEVMACAGEPYPKAIETLRDWGVRFAPVPIARAGMNPLNDLRTCVELIRFMRRVKPDTVLAYTIKPVIWGGLAARLTGVRRSFSLITGLGYAFTNQTADHRPQTEDQMPETTSRKQRLAGWVAKRLYKTSLKHSRKVFFQNPDDQREFVETGLVNAHKCVVVSGSGVDIKHFQTADCQPITDNRQPATFLLIARLLWDKGIGEYVRAARSLRGGGQRAEGKTADCRPSFAKATAGKPQTTDLVSTSTGNLQPVTANGQRPTVNPFPRFLIAGSVDPNPSSVSQHEMDAWASEGVVNYLGYLEDVRQAYEQCSVYVLPSYREGTPRTVLEAMAMGRPIITTDAPGCRETVRPKGGGETADHRPQTAAVGTDRRNQERREYEVRGKLKIGLNGILVPPRDTGALAEAMRFFIDHPDQIAIMGRESRRYAENRYDVHKVNEVMLREMGLLRPLSGRNEEGKRARSGRNLRNLYRTHLKRALDFVTAGLGLLLLSPLLALLALLVRRKLGSPVLFHQQRPGLHGKPFTLLKFRSMTDARDADGNLLPDAERLTPFGKFLRKSSLDELPELWNVLKGEMSLVGPRPLLMEYLPCYTDHEAKRHDVRPGLTGLSQISGRNRLLWDARLDTDVRYVEKMSFLLDIKIILLTIWQITHRQNVLVVPGILQGRLDDWRSMRARDGNGSDDHNHRKDVRP